MACCNGAGRKGKERKEGSACGPGAGVSDVPSNVLSKHKAH